MRIGELTVFGGWLGRRLLLLHVLLWSCLACASTPRQLHPVGGNGFTLFPPPEREPEPAPCALGELDRRFECLKAELEGAAQKLEVSGAMAIVAREGPPRFFSHTGPGAPEVTADTPFALASVSKMFVAATALVLAEEGQLDLHAPIARYLPELREEVGPGSATMHQLLTHTAGMPQVYSCGENALEGSGGDPRLPPGVRADIGDAVRAYASAPLWAPPGAVHSYSNLGYTFAGAVLERASGQSFEAAVQEKVLRPMQLSSAGFDLDAVGAPRPPPDGRKVPRCRAVLPAGGLVMSMRDLSRWALALGSGESFGLGASVRRQLTTPHVLLGTDEEGDPHGYGYGIGVMRKGDLTLLAHAGGMPDASAFLLVAVERGVAATAAVNAPGDLPRQAVARSLRTLFDVELPKAAVRAPNHPLQDYVGVYRDEVGQLGTVAVTLEDGQLMLDPVGEVPDSPRPPHFRFAFDDSSPQAKYLVTPVGIGHRVQPERSQ